MAPDIILIIADQFRGDALGADGSHAVHTPNLDFLATHGTRFSHAYSTVPSCVPARAMLFSGLNQWHAGILGMGKGQGPIPNDFPSTLAGTLTAAGYQTQLIGKGHFHPQRTPMGFEAAELDESGRMEDSDHRRWFREQAPAGVTPDDHGVDWNSWHARPWHTAEHLHPTAWTMARSLEFLRQRDAHRPCFLNISFARPHSPYVPPAFYYDRYFRGQTSPPHLGDWSAMHDDPRTAADPNAWRGDQGAGRIHAARSGYFGEVSFIDTQIGRLLNQLARLPKRRDTWIIFTSDHGDMLGDHHLWRKTYAYEGSTRIPLLMTRLGGEPAARQVADEVVTLSDLMPTCLDLAGLPPQQHLDGCSLAGLRSTAATGWRSHVHGEHSTCYAEEQEMQFVTDGRRKFIWLPRIGLEQFFDLEADPGECQDLCTDPNRQDEVDRWRERLVAELAGRDCGWIREGKLHCGPWPLVSPWKERRYTASHPA